MNTTDSARTSDSTPLLLRALANEHTDRPPVWFMRQAGRFLPEYRAMREQVSFLQLCHDPELACEATMQPLRRFPFDATIVFSDILLPLECMGKELTFGKGMGPQFPDPVRDLAGVKALKPFDPWRDLPEPMQTIKLLNERAGVPVHGFAGAPFTLACYLVEGSGSKTWQHLKQFMYGQPEAFQLLMDTLADAVGAHLQAQAEAGASVVQLFDTWAGALAPEEFRRYALPAARRALSYVKDGTPTLYFTKDSGPFLPWLRESEADAIGLDWRVDIAWARSILGDIPVQGNLDPMALYAPPADIRKMVHRIIKGAGPKGHVFNLGHGITPATPIEGVAAAVAAVREWSWAEQPNGE